MILEPWKSREEIDRRLSALTDPELAELLRAAGRELLEDESETYTAPSAPHWKKRVAYLALAGLIAMSAGYAATSREHQGAAVKPPVPAALPHRTASHAVPPVRHVAKHHVAPVHHAIAVYKRVAFPPVHTVSAAPSEAAVRRAQAQVLHERAIAQQAQADVQRAHHQAQLAMQAQAQANQQALEAALARANAQARADALAKAQADALARQQSEAEYAAQQEQALQNATDPGIKPGEAAPPSGGGRMSTYPSPNNPAPMPGPVLDPSCTPHRGSFFTSALNHVRVGGTSVGGLLRLIHNP